MTQNYKRNIKEQNCLRKIYAKFQILDRFPIALIFSEVILAEKRTKI